MSDRADASGLIAQRRGNKSGKLQDHLVVLAGRYPGYTINQLSWIAAGFHVDANGFCQPSDLYQKVQRYFNGKRRGSEVACAAEVYPGLSSAKRSKVKLLYCDAKRNPYTESGGLGVRPVSDGAEPVAPAKPEAGESAGIDLAALEASLEE